MPHRSRHTSCGHRQRWHFPSSHSCQRWRRRSFRGSGTPDRAIPASSGRDGSAVRDARTRGLTSCSPCPTRVRRNGISRTRPGSSKNSCSSMRRMSARAYEFHDASFRYLFNSYYNAVGPMHTRSSRGLLSRPTVQQVLAYRKGSTSACSSCLEKGLAAGARTRADTRIASRATAPGAAAHRHQTPVLVQSAAAGLHANIGAAPRARGPGARL